MPAPAAGLETVGVRSFDLSPDGNVMFFEGGDFGLRRTVRVDRASVFEPPTVISSPRVGWMTVSADERLLFGNREDLTGSVWAARDDVSQPFVDQGNLSIGGTCATANIGDADITPDGARLVLRCTGSIYLLTH